MRRRVLALIALTTTEVGQGHITMARRVGVNHLDGYGSAAMMEVRPWGRVVSYGKVVGLRIVSTMVASGGGARGVTSTTIKGGGSVNGDNGGTVQRQ